MPSSRGRELRLLLRDGPVKYVRLTSGRVAPARSQEGDVGNAHHVGDPKIAEDREAATLDKQRQLVADALFVLFDHWVKPEKLGCCPWTPEDWRTQADSLLRQIGVPTDSGEAP